MIALKKQHAVFIGLLVLLVLGAFKFLHGSASLQRIHSAIEASYQNVTHISAEEFERFEQSNTLVFDVRESQEHEVSHLPNAIWLDPNTSPENFVEDFGAELAGKRVVFYCSVGRRSSDMLSRLLDDPDAGSALQQAQLTANLEGGVFAWANSERDLVDSKQQTTLKVHPFNAFWGRLINDRSKQQY